MYMDLQCIIIFILMNREDTLIKITIKLIIFSYSENSVFLSRKPLCHIYVISNEIKDFLNFADLNDINCVFCITPSLGILCIVG